MPTRVGAYRRSVVDKWGHHIRVKEWPSEEGLASLRRHYKRKHPKAFRASIRKGLRTKLKRGVIKKAPALKGHSGQQA